MQTQQQESTHQYIQDLLSRFSNRENSIAESTEDLILEIIGEGKGRKGKPTKRHVALATRLLLKVLRYDLDYRHRAAAARMLSELPSISISTERALIKALQDRSVRVRACAAMALGEHKCTSAVQPLLDLLQGEESDHVRIRATKTEDKTWWLSEEQYRWIDYTYAIEALGEIGDQQAVEPFIALLRREPPEVVEPVMPSIPEGRLVSWEQVPPDEPVWHKHFMRAQLMEALAEFTDPRVTEIACELLADGQRDMGFATLRALDQAFSPIERLQGQQVLSCLVNALSFRNHDLCWYVHLIFPRFSPRDAVIAELITALSRDSLLIRKGAVSLLGDLKATQAVESLLAMLSSEEDSSLRENLILALGKIGSSQARELLYLLLQEFDGRPPVEDAADNGCGIYSALLLVLAQLGEERVMDVLLDALTYEDSTVQSRAIDGLAALGGQRAVEALISHLRDWKAWESPYRRSFCYHPSSIIHALAELGDQRAVEPLCELLTTQSVEEQRKFDGSKIAKALGKLGDRSAVPALITAFQQEAKLRAVSSERYFSLAAAYTAEALGILGDPRANKVLIAYLKDHKHIDWKLAPYVIEALGKLGSPVALPALKWVLRFDSDKILELPPKVRMDYRFSHANEKAQEAIRGIMEANQR